jgi:hypothetical protein
MTKATKAVATQPTVVLFGLSSIGKPRAGVFKGTNVAAAQKAAGKLGLHIYEVSDQAGRALAAKVPAGRIQAHGKAVVPFVPKQLYASLETLARPKPNSGAVENAGRQLPAATGPRLPANWDDIRVGDRVLAQDTDPADGWWQVNVVEKVGDVFKLRWQRSERGRPFQKHRLTLGLICPIEVRSGQPTDPKKPTAASSARFPQDWAAIGLDQIVLAKEDGPCEQWWEARTIKLDKDVFTLRWRDQPNLPPIERPRSSLGLVHPAPKTR